jgi:hypothetical protein
VTSGSNSQPLAPSRVLIDIRRMRQSGKTLRGIAAALKVWEKFQGRSLLEKEGKKVQ